jgi:hypothetical protein
VPRKRGWLTAGGIRIISAACWSGEGWQRSFSPREGFEALFTPVTQVREIRPASGSIPDPPEAIHQPIHRKRDTKRIGNIKTNRPQFNHDATVGEHDPLDAMRLRVIEPNHITSP